MKYQDEPSKWWQELAAEPNPSSRKAVKLTPEENVLTKDSQFSTAFGFFIFSLSVCCFVASIREVAHPPDPRWFSVHGS